ncbi:hypothetical protein ABZ461_19305 [Actinacidiphila glaucinigra]|uniref:hypothetical protein n=1 Tax=Actinacidiphila glaucinigra TaxID=235986 RepID=UPI0033EC2780
MLPDHEGSEGADSDGRSDGSPRFLCVNGHALTCRPEDAAILMRGVIAGEAPIRDIAPQLLRWAAA